MSWLKSDNPKGITAVRRTKAMPTDLNLSFRKALASDMDYLLWLRKETMNIHLTNAGVKVSESNHLKGLLYQFDDAQIILLNKQKIGLLKISVHQEHVEIIQIQIEPQYQGKGIGKQIIEQIMDDARKAKLSVILSVLKKNTAKNLYEQLGFEIIGEDDYSFIMKFK